MNYHALERAIGHTFADESLLDLAMTHPSYALQHKCRDNQRLEFLGDAVLEICVSRVLYHKFPKLKEGQLTRRRASLVCEANLAEAARRFGLGAFLKLDRGEEVVGGRENPSILADTMEAVIAAVYLDAGMDKAALLVDLAMGDYESAAGSDRDAKSALQEYLQALGEETPTYEIIGQDGPPHARVFTARVLRADGTELGRLQRGFNQMAAGLQERERLRDLFGRHVGRDVAEAAELDDPELGGRDARVGVVFVDIIGSTEMAVRAEAAEVVEVLNRFFAVVVETVEEYDGIVDSFLGDAALVVFGAPRSMDDSATAALACARTLAERLPQRVPGCRAGIGASYGNVVAGYVGSDDRFEYTVIGDAVNEASRLCDLAKNYDGLVLASGAAVAGSTPAEAGRWQSAGSEVVRGRDEPTELCIPR